MYIYIHIICQYIRIYDMLTPVTSQLSRQPYPSNRFARDPSKDKNSIPFLLQVPFNKCLLCRWTLSVRVDRRAILVCSFKVNDNMNVVYFDWLDYLVFGSMLLSSALIGVYFAFFASKKQNTTSEYLMGGKAMGMFPISMSLIARYLIYISSNQV